MAEPEPPLGPGFEFGEGGCTLALGAGAGAGLGHLRTCEVSSDPAHLTCEVIIPSSAPLPRQLRGEVHIISPWPHPGGARSFVLYNLQMMLNKKKGIILDLSWKILKSSE